MAAADVINFGYGPLCFAAPVPREVLSACASHMACGAHNTPSVNTYEQFSSLHSPQRCNDADEFQTARPPSASPSPTPVIDDAASDTVVLHTPPASPPPPAVPSPPADVVETRPNIGTVRVLHSISEAYELGEFLGDGKTATVRTAVCRRSKATRALKIVKKSVLLARTTAANIAAQEVEILRRVRHENIVRVHEVIETDTDFCIVLDKMETDLYYWVKRRKQLTEDDARSIMMRLLSGVVHLHAMGIVHRDIKPENILINSATDIRIADFGHAKVATEMNTPVGTSFYMAPEMVRGIEGMGGDVAALQMANTERVKFVDMWSLGIVLYILLCGRPPFLGRIGDAEERKQLLGQIDRGVLFEGAKWGHLWKGVSDAAKDLVVRLLTQDPSQRLTAAQALGHRWFRGAGGGALHSPSTLQDVDRHELAQHIDGLRDDVHGGLCDGNGGASCPGESTQAAAPLLPGAIPVQEDHRAPVVLQQPAPPPRRKPRPGDRPIRRVAS